METEFLMERLGRGTRPEHPPRLHTLVVNALTRQIVAGEFKPGAALPPEPVLAEQFGVSRMVVREAVRVLAAKGMSAFGVFLMRQFIFTIPSDFVDAARIDGASEFDIYRQVILPLTKPALATLGILTFFQNWDSFFWPLIVITEDSLRTLPLGLTYFRSNYITYWNQLLAASLLATLPILVVFVAFQSWFYKGMVMSGLKG